MRHFIGLLIILTSLGAINAQESAKYRDRFQEYKLGKDLFEQNVYIAAMYEMDKYVHQPDLPHFEKFERLVNDARALAVISALRAELPQAENEVVNFVDDHFPDPISHPVLLELASYYYNQKRYSDAVYYYDKMDLDGLSLLEMSEASFKKGYSLFIQKKFKEARAEFSRVKEIRNEYYYPVNYYHGMSLYFENDYASAVESFKRAGNSTVYGPYIPYYLAQIYFATKEYDKLIGYAEQKANEPNVLNRKEIRQLLGQAYYIRRDFQRALPHLEYYEANTEKLTAEEFYQLAFTQYQVGKYNEAKDNFLEITNEVSRMGQQANYYLADCYLKLGDKNSARAAFKKVSGIAMDPGLQEEATFNYGKLSAELGFEREGINVLVGIGASSPYYAEAQNIINDILVNSRDYANSINIIESLPKLSPKIEATYQNLTLKRAKQLYIEGDRAGTEVLLNKSINYPRDANYLAQAQFWLAKLSSDKKDYPKSIREFEKFLGMAQKVKDLPVESGPGMANYYQGYNYLKLKNYEDAEAAFKNAIIDLNVNRNNIKDEVMMARVLPDAFIRAGDCLFKLRDYAEAKTFYDQAISRKQAGYVYAMYQRAQIEGLLGDSYKKILTLEEIRDEHKNSEYYDDALFVLGDTYQTMGTMDKAAVSYLTLVDNVGNKSPFYNTALLRLGLITYNQGDIQGALTYYKRVIANDPNPKERGEALLGVEEIYIKDLAQADKYLAYLDSVPGFELTEFSRDSLNYTVAKNFYLNADYRRAVTALSDYLTKFPTGFYKKDALYYRADCHNINKDYNKALADYEEIIAMGPTEYEERSLNKAAIIAYNYSQNFTAALKYYKAYEEMVNDPAEKYAAQLGALRSAFRLSRDADVYNYAQKVIQSSLSSSDEKTSANFYLAKTHYKNNSLDLAIPAFQKVASAGNNNQSAESRYLIAEAYFKLGRMDAAEKQCEETNEKSGNYPYWVAKSLLLMSDIYVNRSDLLNARAAIEAVIENFKDDNSITTLATEKLKNVEKLEAENNRIKPPSDGQLEMQQPGGGN